VALAAPAGLLTPGRYVTLLAASSLLHTWGSAGRYTMLAGLLPAGHRLAGNALMSVLGVSGWRPRPGC